MKRLLARIRRPAPVADDDPAFFSSVFHEGGESPTEVSTWRVRAQSVGAVPIDRTEAVEMFAALWARDKHVVALKPDELRRLSSYFDFVRVPPQREVIGQDELGNYMMVLLDGSVAVDRVHPWGTRSRLAEAHPGDMLGEMSLLDAGARFSACATLTGCAFAVVDTERLDEMVAAEPRLALALLASLSRRLSLRLRHVSARLSALLAEN